MIVSAIVAMARNRVIGKDNSIPWYLPADLRYFKKVTTGHVIIMGRNCFESIGRPLPNRTNVIVTRDPFYLAAGCLIVHSPMEAIRLAQESGETEAFIIGGGQLYDQTEPLWDRLYLTELDIEPEGDVFFSDIRPDEWRETFREEQEPTEKTPFSYRFLILERKEQNEGGTSSFYLEDEEV